MVLKAATAPLSEAAVHKDLHLAVGTVTGEGLMEEMAAALVQAHMAEMVANLQKLLAIFNVDWL